MWSISATGGPITIGYGRWVPGQGIEETMAADDVSVVLEERMSIPSNGRTVTAGPGEIVYIPKAKRSASERTRRGP
jgi:ethanolamine utilization protein EutQ (cupin superfamily)